MGSTVLSRTVRLQSDSTQCTGDLFVEIDQHTSLCERSLPDAELDFNPICASCRKEWEAALEAKRTVSASNRKVEKVKKIPQMIHKDYQGESEKEQERQHREELCSKGDREFNIISGKM